MLSISLWQKLVDLFFTTKGSPGSGKHVSTNVENWLFCSLGPPRVAFSWRHWAHWTGPYKGRAPTGELLELRGMAVAEVDENLKIKSIDVHYDPNQLLMKLEGNK